MNRGSSQISSMYPIDCLRIIWSRVRQFMKVDTWYTQFQSSRYSIIFVSPSPWLGRRPQRSWISGTSENGSVHSLGLQITLMATFYKVIACTPKITYVLSMEVFKLYQFRGDQPKPCSYKTLLQQRSRDLSDGKQSISFCLGITKTLRGQKMSSGRIVLSGLFALLRLYNTLRIRT